MNDKKVQCIICAYRESCQKQFSLKAGRICPEFAKDLSLKEKETETEPTESK